MRDRRLGSSLNATDLYCGAGGSSTGISLTGIGILSAANHWERAIETHKQNHPQTRHYIMDIRDADPRQFPYTPLLWASPTCNAHTLSAGRRRQNDGQLSMFEEEQDSLERERATMGDVIRFTEHHRYQAVVVENVVDVKYWRHYDAWLRRMSALGYDYRVSYFNSMFAHPLNGQSDFAPQSRDRWYTVFWRQGNKAPDLDFRPSAYCPKCERDVEAIQVFKKQSFPRGLYDSTGKRGQYFYACPTIHPNSGGRHGIRLDSGRTALFTRVEPYYFAALNCIDFSLPITRIRDRKRPLRLNTIRRIRIGLDKFGSVPLVVRLTRTHHRGNCSWPTEKPMPTQTTRQSLAFVSQMKGEPEYVHFGHAGGRPMPTQTTVGSPALLIVEMYKNGTCRPASDPLQTVTAGGRRSGICVLPGGGFIVNYNGNGKAHGLADPLGTVTNVPRHAFIANMQANNTGTSMAAPLPTVLTGNHKYLVETAVRVEDCYFRMMEPNEVKAAQGFRPDYKIMGNKREQVKQIGGAVSPPVAEMIFTAIKESLN